VQRYVAAKRYFTSEHEALTSRWTGRVFVNPISTGSRLSLFVAKLIISHPEGDIDAAILLTNSAGETKWSHAALIASTAFCWTKGRIKFLQADDDGEFVEQKSPMLGQAFFYFGNDSRQFESEFSKHSCYGPWGCEKIPCARLEPPLVWARAQMQRVKLQ
jgi:DNA N-6-adenine-methyltransferase Dam